MHTMCNWLIYLLSLQLCFILVDAGGRPNPSIGPDPQPANPTAVVTWGAARFSVLTPRLLRMELAGQSGLFDDRPTMAVISRLADIAPPPFSVSTAGNKLTLMTSNLQHLRHTKSFGLNTKMTKKMVLRQASIRQSKHKMVILT